MKSKLIISIILILLIPFECNRKPPRNSPCPSATHKHLRKDFRHKVIEVIEVKDCELRIFADLEELSVISETYYLDSDFYVIKSKNRFEVEVVGRQLEKGMRGDILYCQICRTVFGMLLL